VGSSGRPTRKSMRYPVTAPVSFSWKDENGNRCQGEGTSRDVSETGTFVFAPGCPPTGADVTLRIFLVALPGAREILRVEVDGRVLRVEQATPAGNCGFAVLTKEAILRENEGITGEHNPGDAT
jgi:PilZ domain